MNEAWEKGSCWHLEFLVDSQLWLQLLHRAIIMEVIALYHSHALIHRLLSFIFCLDHIIIYVRVSARALDMLFPSFCFHSHEKETPRKSSFFNA